MTNHAVVGLGFGDEGKGATVDHLCRTKDISLVVRHNGGAQAAHNVVTPDGRHHEFSQWGSGTLAGVGTYLSRFMVVDPLALEPEADHLREVGVEDPWAMLTIDPRALVVTPYHRYLQRLREGLMVGGRHGTCGMGIGEAVRQSLEMPDHVLRWGDLATGEGLAKARHAHDWAVYLVKELVRDHGRYDLTAITEDAPGEVHEELCHAAQRVCGDRAILGEGRVFEGAQGVLLDQDHGFHPHTTWSRTTFANADVLSREAGMDLPRRIGVTRAYSYRHGPGPFPTWDKGWAPPAEPHNAHDEWRGGPRYGPLDLVLLHYALDACGGVDEVAVTHLDTPIPNPVVTLDGPTGKVMRIPARHEQDRGRQEALGAWLGHARPANRLLPDGMQVTASHLRDYFGAFGIRMSTSYGPTSDDRWESVPARVGGYL